MKIDKISEQEYTGFVYNIGVKDNHNYYADDILVSNCYESSSSEGKHGNLNVEFIKSLHPYTELAIGGGNPLSHPDLHEFLKVLKENKIIANITIRQNDFLNNLELLKNYTDNKLLYGIGVSLIEPTDEFIKEIQQFPNAVIHTIAGLLTKEQLIKLFNKKLKILILGYKTRGKGENYKHEFEKDIFLNIEFLKQTILKLTPLFKVVSFDNLAIEQLELQKQINPKVWEEFYMGDDGKHTMYVDLVKQTFSKNSLSEEGFELMSNIEEMFNIVKKL